MDQDDFDFHTLWVSKRMSLILHDFMYQLNLRLSASELSLSFGSPEALMLHTVTNLLLYEWTDYEQQAS